MNAALAGLLAVERALFRRVDLPFGVSVIAVARPRRPRVSGDGPNARRA
jgi:hypothetical protein